MTPAYAELQVTTNFSFLRGASHPEELVATAAALGLEALAVTDRNALAGAVRAHIAAKEHGLRLVVGARIDLRDGPSLLAFPTSRAAYGALARLLTLGRRRAPKGECHLDLADVLALEPGQIFVAVPPDNAAEPGAAFAEHLSTLAARFPGDAFLAGHWLYRGDDDRRLAALAALAERCGTPLVAANDVRAHVPARKPLLDVLTCIRERCTIAEAGRRLDANIERHLKAPAEMARLFAHHPEAVARTAEIARRCRFSLDELRYEYPIEDGTDGRTPQEELEHLTWKGARARFPGGVPAETRATITHELKLIGGLDYAPYFLTVHDIVRFARSRGILCQGRGSAANSAVCYCLGITAVDPGRVDLLFERFVSAERGEPPDIDVDFEHERREEVIQYIYAKYGRDRAGLAATVISYRARSAIREVGKAMGLSADAVSALAGSVWGWSNEAIRDDYVREIGLDPSDRTLRLALDLARELIGFPRHLSQHVGGFVITRGPLDTVVPIENAAMADRTVIEWDKDDLDALGMLKIDVLGLGMLTCIRKAFTLLEKHYGWKLDLATVPPEDPAVYDMLCRADSLGVFQVESRAQMSMLPRLRPRDFYDLVIEVAIVRPGPIQGDMVHPYLRRRNGEESMTYPSPELRRVLEKTLGVPLFQEQAMKIAIVGAGFTPSEADRLRRAMATFRKTGQIGNFREKMVEGMVERGYERAFAERCFKQIEGFGEYGFPESHAASFALLVYVSAWLKCHFPETFAAALINSQPMGFYAPAQIVRDAREHGVTVLPADVNRSDWDCTLEPDPEGTRQYALRLGLRQIKGFKEDHAAALAAARGNGYPDLTAVWRRAGLPAAAMERLARADAFGSLGLDRRQALWAVRALPDEPLPLFAAMGEEERPAYRPAPLPRATAGEEVAADYAAMRLSLKTHPMALLRGEMDALGIRTHAALNEAPDGTRLTAAGLVLVRQRPGSAKGVIFVTLEDETGVGNVVVWPKVYERFRRTVLTARLLAVRGKVQREGIVVHLVAERIEDRSHLLTELAQGDEGGPAGGFDGALARADEVRRPGRDPRDGPLSAGPPKADYPSRDFH